MSFPADCANAHDSDRAPPGVLGGRYGSTAVSATAAFVLTIIGCVAWLTSLKLHELALAKLDDNNIRQLH